MPVHDLEGLPTWTLAEELRLGGLELPTGFIRIEAVVARDKLVYVLDSGASEVRVFDDEGRIAGRFGMEGNGPGEMRYPSDMGFLADTLWVRDGTLRRITLFTADGTPIRTISTPEPVEVAQPGSRPVHAALGQVRSDGFISPALSYQVRDDGTPPHGDSVRIRRVLFDGDGVVLETGEWDTVFPGGLGIQVEVDGFTFFVQSRLLEEHPLTFGKPEAPIIVYRWLPSDPNEGRVVIVRGGPSSGSPVERQYHANVMPIEPATANTLIGHLAELHYNNLSQLFGRSPTVASIHRALEDTVFVPSFAPPITDAVLGEDGSIWLRREDIDHQGDVRWSVLDAEGVPRGEVSLPWNTEVHVIGRDYVWTVVRDEAGLEYLTRNRIRREDRVAH